MRGPEPAGAMIRSRSPVARRTMRGLAHARWLRALVLLALVGGGAFLVRWYSRTHDLRWATQRGLDRLAAARSPAEQRRATLEWEKEAGATLHSRADDWIPYVVSHYSL